MTPGPCRASVPPIVGSSHIGSKVPAWMQFCRRPCGVCDLCRCDAAAAADDLAAMNRVGL
jgi:hypothetical protein